MRSKKLTATIQIFYLGLGLSRSARSPAFRSAPPWQINSPLKKKLFSFNQIYFLKRYIEITKRPERLSRGWQISLIMPSNSLGLLFFKNKPADNILLWLVHGWVWEKNDFFNSLLILKTVFGIKTFGFWNLDFLDHI